MMVLSADSAALHGRAKPIWYGTAVRSQPDLDKTRLIDRMAGGEKAAWDGFVERYSPVIYGAVHKCLRKAGRGGDAAPDVAQDVFLKLCRNNFRVLRQYDPERAKLSTWLTVVATTTTIDHLRRNRDPGLPLDELPEHVIRVEATVRERIVIPPDLLSKRQLLIMRMLYDRDMDVAEVAETLEVNAQTVRSTRHKALVKLRQYFAEEA